MHSRKPSGRHIQLTGPDRWQISYADLITLLLGFFIVMYAVSAMESDERQDLIAQLQASFLGEQSPPAKHGPDTSHVSNTSMGIPVGDTPFFQWVEHFPNSPFSADLQGDWLYLQAASEALFDSGSAELLPEAKAQLDTIAAILSSTQGVIEVEGHTDNVPIRTASFPNNWALSSARAVAIVDYLSTRHNISGERLRAVGYGEFAPIADNATDEGRGQNRRVVIKVETSAIDTLPSPLEAIPNPLKAIPNPLKAIPNPLKAIPNPLKALPNQDAYNQNSSQNNIQQNNLLNEQVVDDESKDASLDQLKQNLQQKGLTPSRTADGRLVIRHDP